MGLDARSRYTRMVIKNSFVELLKKKPVNKVTVKEICELAEINRATFYKHYLDVYDLLDRIEEQFLDELKKSLAPAGEKSLTETLSLIMVSFKAEAETYKTLFSDNGDPMFPQRVFEACYESDSIMEGIAVKKPLSPAKKRWLYNYLAYGCNGILCQWIAGNMEEPISEVVAFTERLVRNTMTNM